MDPRLTIIDERLSRIKRIIAIASGKGGVGKTLISSLMALILSKRNFRVGLLDLDFHGPSCHIVLGARDIEFVEEKGVIPPLIHGIQFMSIVHFAKDSPVPLRGKEVSNAIIELLAITRWGDLDYLIIDLPPGMGDEALDTIRLIKRGEFTIVTTPSVLSINVVRRLVLLLRKIKVNITGIIENMRLKENTLIEEFARENKIRYLGYIPFDTNVDAFIGSPEKLIRTSFGMKLSEIIKGIE